jgi:diguanylate cyclase (GGDEF)-like protein
MRTRLSRNNQVLALIAAMAAASFMVGAAVFFITDADAASVTSASARLVETRAAASRLAFALSAEQSSLDDVVLSGDSSTSIAFDAAVEREQAATRKLIELASDQPEVVRALATFEDASRDWRANLADQVVAAVRTGNDAVIADFRRNSVNDQARIDDALIQIENALRIADRDLVERQDAAAAVKTIGISAAFAFLLAAFGVALVIVRRFGRALERDAEHASVLNRFTEVTSFAGDDHEVASANLVALSRLVRPDASVTHILNRSLDRAVPEATTGDAIAEVLPLHALSRCAGVLRGTVYVTDDLADDLSVHCPIYPASSGTLACVPLISGESFGAVHLYWTRPNALPIQLRQGISRITEHAALAIGNRRLLAALHGQANTDARTSLPNSRAFDLSLETALAARANHEPLSVLMLDVDHFKQFNDRHGHPAGDEALKAFAGILRACMRDGDVAARYGGEEFAVYLPGIDRASALAIADRIRARTEATIISLAPGQTDRITISIGIASAPDDGADRITLPRLADEALYRAKESGRNRVMSMAGDDSTDSARGSAAAGAGPALLSPPDA